MLAVIEGVNIAQSKGCVGEPLRIVVPSNATLVLGCFTKGIRLTPV